MTMPHDLDPNEMSKEEAEDAATHFTQVNADNTNTLIGVVVDPIIDKVLAHEDVLASVYKPVVAAATRQTKKNGKDLSEVANFLEIDVHNKTAQNGGRLKTIVEMMRANGFNPSVPITGRGTVSQTLVDGGMSPLSAGEGLQEANQSVNVGGSTPLGAGGLSSGREVQLGHPNILQESGNGEESTGQGGETGTNVPPVEGPAPQRIAKVDETTGEGIGTSGRIPPPPIWQPNPTCAELGPRMVFIVGEGWKCVDRYGNPIDDKCCHKPVQGDTCAYIPPPEGATQPTVPPCPPPTISCPKGTGWFWDDTKKVWVCGLLNGNKPTGTTDDDCTKLKDKVRITVMASCEQLPQKMRDQLKECGFDLCYEQTSTDTDDSKNEINPQWDGLFDRVKAMFFNYSP